MKVREALSRLKDWQLADLIEFHHDQEESYSLEQFRQNLERLKEDFDRSHSEKATKWDLSLEAKVSATPSVGLTLKGQDITNAKWIQRATSLVKGLFKKKSEEPASLSKHYLSSFVGERVHGAVTKEDLDHERTRRGLEFGEALQPLKRSELTVCTGDGYPLLPQVLTVTDHDVTEASTLRPNLVSAIATKNVRELEILTEKTVTLPESPMPYDSVRARGAIRVERLIVDDLIATGGDIEVADTLKAFRVESGGMIIAGRIHAKEIDAKSDIRTTENLTSEIVNTSGDLRVGWELDASHFIGVGGQFAAGKITRQSITAAGSGIRGEVERLYRQQEQESLKRPVSLGITNRL
jgi:hypothetical protein